MSHRQLPIAAICFLIVAASHLPVLAQEGGEIRVENEFKLSVPDAQKDAVRDYLKVRYGTGSDSILPEFGDEFTARISDEGFVDHYFDTPDLDLIRMESGVRQRQRWNLVDPINDPKHGRQLLQVKLRRADDRNPLNRTEVKFDIDPPTHRMDSLDKHPLMGLVSRNDRPDLMTSLEMYGIDAASMRPTLTIEQRRWRVYVSRAGTAFATLTLDEVKSAWHAWKVAFVELEIELNEIAYTESSPQARTEMEAFTRRMTEDIRSAFPSIKQDQTPKYNKVFNRFSEKIPGFKILVIYGETLSTVLFIGGVLALSLAVPGVHFVRRYTAQRREEELGILRRHPNAPDSTHSS